MGDEEEDYFQEEVSRRCNQISQLRDDLWDLRDRADQAHDRTGVLHQNIARLKAEVGIRKAKANELEDQAALNQAKVDDVARRLAADASAGVARVAMLRQQLAQLDQAYQTAQGDAEDAQQLMAQKQAEAGALKAVLEARKRDSSRARAELEQDEERAEVQQRRLVAHHQEMAAERVKDAEGSLAVVASAAATARAELVRLERGLVAERECTEGLEKALRHTAEQHEQALEEASTLERELEGLDAKAAEEELIDELATSRLKCQHLSQDLANARRHALLHTQSIQGALEETRRMMNDHLTQTRQHIDQTARCPNESSLAVLVSALTEARSRSASSTATARSLERERAQLLEEVKRTEEAVATEKEKGSREKASHIEEELNTARQALDAGSRRVGAKADELRRAEAAVVEAERIAKEHETFLRSKLEELWRMLKMYRPDQSPVSRHSFSPQARASMTVDFGFRSP